MAESKSAALPLGYAPTGRFRKAQRPDASRGFPTTPVYRGSSAISTGGGTISDENSRGDLGRIIIIMSRSGAVLAGTALPCAGPRPNSPPGTVERRPVSWEDGGQLFHPE